MKKLLLSISFIIVLSNLSAQKIATKNISYDPFIKRKSNLVLLQNFEKTFIISKYKTTNKEYLCFLQWNYRVFGVDYPEVYKAMLPDTIKYPDIFKPEKLNMLVKGISKKQAQAFCQWRTDRLNEYILIREGILRKDFNQVNEENFNTEAYLSFQYEGNVKNDLLDKFTKKVRPVTQRDFILVPSFYISSKEEIKICNSLNRISKIKNKRKVKSDFDWWFKNEFFILKNSDNNSPFSILKSRLGENKLSNKHKIRSFVRKNKKELAKEIINYDTTVIIYSDKDFRLFNLHNLKSDLRYYKLIADMLPNPFLLNSKKFEKKDSLGKMNFVYIADNYDGTPICIYKSAFEDKSNDTIFDSGFYYSMNVPFYLNWRLMKFFLLNFSPRLYRY